MAVATDPLTGVFDADGIHSSFQFAVRHMNVSTFRASFGDVDARLIAYASEVRLEGAAPVESISIADPPEFREHVVRGGRLLRRRQPPRDPVPLRAGRAGREWSGDGQGRADDQGPQPADHGDGNVGAPGQGHIRLAARGPRASSSPRPARLGPDLADAASRRRRRARLGRRTHRSARARQTALAVRLVALSGSLRLGASTSLFGAVWAQRRPAHHAA
jgi:hypothetical protein